MLLVAFARHRSCGSQDETRMETSNIHCHHHIYLTLPIQKNDTAGMCVSRGRNRVCERDHSNPICPYCAMIRREKRLRYLLPQNDIVPFIPEPDGSHPSKYTIIQIFRRAIQSTGAELFRPGPNGQAISRFSEHVRRVSGAQFLTTQCN